MELKLNKNHFAALCGHLLIVPYGIETVYLLSVISLDKLLIVPYGIETTVSRFVAVLPAAF